jgi:hypothetical protein
VNRAHCLGLDWGLVSLLEKRKDRVDGELWELEGVRAL